MCARGTGAGMGYAETLDYGYPQILTPNMLQLYITQKGVKGAEEKVRGLFASGRVEMCVKAVRLTTCGSPRATRAVEGHQPQQHHHDAGDGGSGAPA